MEKYENSISNLVLAIGGTVSLKVCNHWPVWTLENDKHFISDFERCFRICNCVLPLLEVTNQS